MRGRNEILPLQWRLESSRRRCCHHPQSLYLATEWFAGTGGYPPSAPSSRRNPPRAASERDTRALPQSKLRQLPAVDGVDNAGCYVVSHRKWPRPTGGTPTRPPGSGATVHGPGAVRRPPLSARRACFHGGMRTGPPLLLGAATASGADRAVGGGRGVRLRESHDDVAVGIRTDHGVLGREPIIGRQRARCSWEQGKHGG